MTPNILVFCHRSEGTGKSVSALNLAYEWAQAGINTLIIDLDPDAPLTQIVLRGMALTQQSLPDLSLLDQLNAHQWMLGEQAITAESLGLPVCEHLWLLPGKLGFMAEDAQVQMHQLKQRLQAQADALAKIQRIIIDTPPNLDPWVINALQAAQILVIPFIPDMDQVLDTRSWMHLVKQISQRHNPQVQTLLLPTHWRKKDAEQEQVLHELGEHFGHEILLRGIREHASIREAAAKGQSLQKAAPQSLGAFDYHLFAEALEVYLGAS